MVTTRRGEAAILEVVQVCIIFLQYVYFYKYMFLQDKLLIFVCQIYKSPKIFLTTELLLEMFLNSMF